MFHESLAFSGISGAGIRGFYLYIYVSPSVSKRLIIAHQDFSVSWVKYAPASTATSSTPCGKRGGFFGWRHQPRDFVPQNCLTSDVALQFDYDNLPEGYQITVKWHNRWSRFWDDSQLATMSL